MFHHILVSLVGKNEALAGAAGQLGDVGTASGWGAAPAKRSRTA